MSLAGAGYYRRMSPPPPYELVAFFILVAMIIVAHGWWCLSRGIYHARSLRVVREESPIEFWFWQVLQFAAAGLLIGGAGALVLQPIPR